jgi:hypothetical protein
MAVLDGVPGLEVTVLANGAPLEEYIDADEETSRYKAVQYVEAVSGAEFQVKHCISSAFKVKGSNRGVKIELHLDGKYVGSHILLRNRIHSEHIFKGVQEKVDNQCIVRRMCFSELEIGESFTDVEL